jgi:DNA repair exonuclease SbcCD ATPase subunit
MSQTETVMLVALGFVAALMVSLLVIRALWSYAVGLGRRRVERRAPSHIAELKADRDRLKAEFAMQGRRLQLRLDDLKTRMAEQMAEASRNRNRMEQLAADLASRDAEIGKRDAEIEALKAQADSLERELTQRTEMTQAARDDLREREDEIASLRAQLMALQAGMGEQLRVADASGSPATANPGSPAAQASNPDPALLNEAELRLRKRIDELNALTRQIDDQRRDLSFQHKELNTLREEIDRSRQLDEAAGNGKAAGAPAAKAGDDPAVSLTDIETVGNQLEQQIIEAERETENLTRELAELDDIWNNSMARFEDNEAVKAATAKQEKPSAGPAERGKAKTRTKRQAKAGKTATAAAGKSSAGKSAAGKSAAAKSAAGKSAAGKRRSKAAAGKAASAKPSGKTPARQSEPAGNQGEDGSGNVISLAQRIRALQGDLGSKG